MVSIRMNPDPPNFDMPVVTLKNGLMVGNFSSPHPFTFTDGTILERCHAERSKALELITNEVVIISSIQDVQVSHIQLTFALSADVSLALNTAHLKHLAFKVDIVLVPLPVMQCIREMFDNHQATILKHPIRVIRTADRETKVIHTDKFCL